jgi:hypothetical protein
MAHAVMLRTRDQLIEMHKNLDHDGVDKMTARHFSTSEILNGKLLRCRA